jgi:diketogulonate reductase-like aldo/keto reductase
MKTLRLAGGVEVPVLGQGTWYIGEMPDETRGETPGEGPARAKAEAAALQLGIELGMSLVDTAEMYAEGGAEEVVGRAIAGRRKEVFLVSKVYPHNADSRGVPAACKRSLSRLGTDYLDLYLLHWRGAVPLPETLEAFAALKSAGAIRAYGVSNFDTADMKQAYALPGGKEIAVNQVLYNLARRGPEWELLPWCRAHGVAVMAYSPLESSSDEQRRLLSNAGLKAVAARHRATPAQIALAWLLAQEGVIVIPKAVDPAHVRENRAAADIVLTAQDMADLDRAFPPPRGPGRLEMR